MHGGRVLFCLFGVQALGAKVQDTTDALSINGAQSERWPGSG